MAQRVQTVLISDLSGDEVEAGLESVAFSYRGVDYVIDLTEKEAAGFDRAVAMYVEHARPAPRTAGPRRASRRTSGGTEGTARPAASDGHAERIGAIKRWATEEGLDYPQRGRLPKSLVEQYDAAH